LKLSGARTIRAEPDAIWDFLLTPERLRACLPGCERLEATSPTTFEGTMSLGIGFLRGSYAGKIEVVEQRRPQDLTLHVTGGGGLGKVDATGTVRFVSTGGGATYLLYDGQAAVSGRVTFVGERVIEATATRLFGLFFDCVARHVEVEEG
jgi:carbon monoxide dehydrogenase subunit G